MDRAPSPINVYGVRLVGGKANGRLEVHVETAPGFWRRAIDERWPGGEAEIDHVVNPSGIASGEAL